MTGLTRSAPGRGPRGWRRIMGAPANPPPTWPWLALNSSKIWAFQSAMPGSFWVACPSTMTRGGSSPASAVIDRRRRPEDHEPEGLGVELVEFLQVARARVDVVQAQLPALHGGRRPPDGRIRVPSVSETPGVLM